MDKKNTAIGLILLIIGFGLMYVTTPDVPPPTAKPQSPPEESGSETSGIEPIVDPAAFAEQSMVDDPAALVEQAASAVVEEPADFLDDQPVILENDYVRLSMTRKGAALLEVSFKKTDPNNDFDTYVFNQGAQQPALGLYLDIAATPQPFFSEFQLISQTSDRLVFQWDAPKGNYSIQRTFALDGGETRPYHISHKTVIINKSEAPLRLPDMFFSLGTAFPLDTDPGGQYLNFVAYSGDSIEKYEMTDFTGSSGFFGFGAKSPVEFRRESHANVTWAAAKNQYFVSLLIPDEPLNTTVFSEGAPYQTPFVANADAAGVFGAVSYPSPSVQAGEESALSMTFYIGPKEISRLRDIGGNTVELMEFGLFFGWISEGLLVVMSWFHGFVGNWGISIILLTLSIKLLFWWPTGKGMVMQKLSAKRMQGLAGPIKELREKHASNPQKMQKEMMELYRKYDVNPLSAVAGCLPILIQMPIFFGLFGMLRTASELRLESFLWIDNLARPDELYIFPDTLPFIGGFALNLLPILYGATAYFQMSMMPQQTAGMDEQQLMMQKMFKIMPWFFTIILYSFASALSVYWIASNLLAITQMAFVNKKIQPQLDQIEAEQEAQKVAEAKPVKAAGKKNRKR
ncbi:MAG: membrane protein insertase YidC [Verrucomicrobiota bacterium]